MSVTAKDVGKRVKFITNYDGQSYRYGKLDKFGQGKESSHVLVEPDRFYQSPMRSQLIGSDRLELAEVQLSQADVGRVVLWTPPAPAKGGLGKLVRLTPHSGDERLTSAEVQFFDGRQMIIWAKHLALDTALPNWQDISTAPKGRQILVLNKYGVQAVAVWSSSGFTGSWVIVGTATVITSVEKWQELPAPPEKPKTAREVAEAHVLACYNDTINMANSTATVQRKAKQNYINAQNAYFAEVQKQGGKPINWLIKEGKVVLMVDSPFSHFSSEKLAEWVIKDPTKYATAAADRLLWLSQQRHYERFKQGNLS